MGQAQGQNQSTRPPKSTAKGSSNTELKFNIYIYLMKAKVSYFQAPLFHLLHAWHHLEAGAESSWQGHGGTSAEVQRQTDRQTDRHCLGTTAPCRELQNYCDIEGWLWNNRFLLLLWWLSHFTPYLSPFHKHSGWIKWIKKWLINMNGVASWCGKRFSLFLSLWMNHERKFLQVH